MSSTDDCHFFVIPQQENDHLNVWRQSVSIGEEGNGKWASRMTGILYCPDLVGYAGSEVTIQQLSYLSYPMFLVSLEIVKNIKILFIAVLSYYSKNWTQKNVHQPFSSWNVYWSHQWCTAFYKKMKLNKNQVNISLFHICFCW